MASVFKYFSLSALILLLAIIFQAYRESGVLINLTETLTSLMRLEKISRVDKVPKIAIGFGCCTDLTVHFSDILNYTESIKDLKNNNNNNDEINTMEDFLKSFYFYFSISAAAERYTKNKDLFNQLLSLAKKQPSANWELGGNSCIMGTRFLLEKMEVLLGATMSEKQKGLLINGFDMVDFTPPKGYKDDVHIIIEYKTGDTFGDLTATRANRYILHSDIHSPMISSLELLDVNSYSPNLFVVSGLQMLDNFPFPDPSIRSERIVKVKEKMSKVDKSTLIHFEMASYVEDRLLSDITQHVLPYTDSIGCNEQEIDNLMNFLEYGKISLSADSNPRVARVLDQTRKVFKILNQGFFQSQDNAMRLLSRIHVHTLAFQLILNVKDSKWKNIRSAAAKSSLVAHRHVCQTNYVNPENAIILLDDSFSTSTLNNDANETDNLRPERVQIKKNSPVGCWKEMIKIDEKNSLEVKICIAPNMICKEAKKTVGAGGEHF